MVREIYGQKIVGHDRDLTNLKEKVEQCYVRGDRVFVKDVAEIVSDTIQKDDNRERIKKYAKE